ncbi:unnamed protein product [Eruca vesicaria subsp. sativa]|uniref:FBD domain-containing protein n=1 Tax=Eruca vesicaria subsp. sativa TaxID=29727 RepID=A0ABC8J5V6_ERUVS|nr:unnamed protein product [Eruca vesicaria subsp. sativa]
MYTYRYPRILKGKKSTKEATDEHVNSGDKLFPKIKPRNININYVTEEKETKTIITCVSLPSAFHFSSRLSLVDVPAYGSLSLSSLKTLRLLSVKFSRDESVQKLLSICPVLEELVVRRSGYSNVKIFTINVPTLTSLYINYLKLGSQPAGVHGFVINAPSLRYLNIKDRHSNYLQFTNMPELVKANVEAVCNQSESLIGSLASVRHLSLCSRFSNIPYHDVGPSFVFLEHLELCTCSSECWNLLARMVKDPLRLRVLKLKSVVLVVIFHDASVSYWEEITYKE